jgi:hypothetical protein
MWEIFSFGITPYWEIDSNEKVATFVCSKKERLIPPENCPKTLQELMLKCWSESTSERPSCEWIVKEIENHISYVKQQQTIKQNLNIYL